ncbi:MAG: tRNA uracil 4-sulfurtransferase ThiI [Candidatus Magasanikbacteria bacterium]
MQHRIIIHYDEIALKSGNKRFFEDTLIKDIQQKMRHNHVQRIGRVMRMYGRIRIDLTELTEEQKQIWIHILTHTFGIAYFSFGFEVEQTIEAIETAAFDELKKRENTFNTFRITTKRPQKHFPLHSQEVSVRVGGKIYEELGKAVDLHTPDITVFIEIVDNKAFIYTEKIQGPGGLPLGCSGKAIVLISGGFDSPVAAYYAMKRGLSIRLVHFHAEPFTSPASTEKVREIHNILKAYNPRMKLFVCAFGQVQKKIMLAVPEKYRIIFYRRFMLAIAEKISNREKAKALVTGDSLGQVASQTIENMTAVSAAVKKIILRPLVGFDKNEIIHKAEEIGTAQISILPHDDCCTLFTPRFPETRANFIDIDTIAKTLPEKELISEALQNITKES